MRNARRRKSRSQSRGAELVEFAFILVLLLVFLLGVVDWGITMFIEHTISQRAGYAARYAAVTGKKTPEISNIVRFGSPTCDGCSPFLGLEFGDVTFREVIVPDSGTGTGAVEARTHLEVTVSGITIVQFTPFFGKTLNAHPIVTVHPMEPTW